MKVTTITPKEGGCQCFFLHTEKPAIIDVGMLYAAEETIEATKTVLDGRTLEYIILTHSHYDHIGALTEFRKAFPEAKVVSSQVTADVFKRPGAIKVMKEMTEHAYEMYVKYPLPEGKWDASGFFVDEIVNDGEIIDLGDYQLTAVYTPGHTNCSYSFFDPTEGTAFLSETLGSVYHQGYTHMIFLKSYLDNEASVERIRALQPKRIFIPHYGEYLDGTPDEYFDIAEKYLRFLKDIILNAALRGCTDDEIVQEMLDKEYVLMSYETPYAAYLANAYPMVKAMHREFPQYWEEA